MHRPARRFHPFGIGRQPFAHPASERGRFIPTDADHRMIFAPGRKAPLAPEPRAGLARRIDKIQHGRPDNLVPNRHLLVAAGIDERLILPIRDRIAIEKRGGDVQRQPLSMRLVCRRGQEVVPPGNARLE